MKTTKRIISILLSLMLVLGAVAAGGMSADGLSNDANLEIGGVTAISEGEIVQSSGEGWSITENENGITLNLDNLDLTYGAGNCCIYAEYLDLTITGSAKLTATDDVSSAIFINEGNLTLNGDFTLRAQCETSASLNVKGNLTVEGGSLSVIKTADNDAIVLGGKMTVNGGSVYAKTESSSDRAIFTGGGITLNNGEAFALGDEDAKEVLIKVPGQPPYITGDIIEYGTYPQSKVEDATLLASLNNLAPENFDDWTSYGYYYTESGTSTYGKMQPGDFMRYFDAVLDGVKYRAVFFTDYRPVNTNYTCSADYSLQTKNGYYTNTVYWFRFDPIEWRVLDPDEGFIVCNSVVDSQAYNNYIVKVYNENSDGEVYYGNGDKEYYANNYEKSSIRAWLNDDFINTAFSTSQQENIEETALNNDAYPESCSHYNSASTNDKVFLLSYAEATNSAYGFNSSASDYDTARWLRGSEYAKCQGLYVYNSTGSGSEVNSFWWLRSPGDYSYDSCAVSNGGTVNNLSSTYITDCGICPAMRLNELKSDPTGAPVTIDPGMELTISPEQPVWGDDITITANLPENATETVTFSLDAADTGTAVTVENGKAVYAIEGKSIEVGYYTVLASYSGDERYSSASAELPFAVNKAETEVHITVEPENPLSGQDVSITATVDGDAKIINFSEHGSTSLGGATLFIDGGVIYTLASETDTVTFNVPGLDAGEHTIKVVYNGDEHYWSAEGETTIFVGRSEPEITVTAEDITYGEAVQATVTVPGNATGNITAGLLKYGGIDPDTNEEIWNAVNGAPASITSGEQFEISGLAAGDYKLTVSLGEDSNYFSGSAEKAFKVNKAEPDMTVTVTPQNPASDGTFTLTVNLPDDATGNVIIRFNEVDLLGYIKLAEGNSQQFNCLRSGTYHGTAKYMPGDGSNYKEVTVEFSFRVSAAAPNMTLTAEDITYGETATVTANLPTDTMWGSVTFFLDNADTGKEVYVSQGKAVCTFSDLNAGEHTIEAVFANDDKYADETKTVTFNVEQKKLTITANDQSYPYNGQTQGEGDTVYEDSAVIKEKVAVDGLVEGDALTSITLDGQAKDIGEYPDSVVPSSAQIKNGNGQDVTTNYNITYTSGKLTITSVNAPLTINYVYANGGEAAETHTEDVEIFTGYSVTSPEITGYAPDKATVEGTMGDLNGVTETVTYTAIEYTATFTADGETVAEIPYTVETESIEAPAVPEKEGFTGEWEEYELTPGGITVNAVYTENEPEDLCPLDNEDHGDGFFGRVLTFLHTLIWNVFRLLGLNVFFKVS